MQRTVGICLLATGLVGYGVAQASSGSPPSDPTPEQCRQVLSELLEGATPEEADAFNRACTAINAEEDARADLPAPTGATSGDDIDCASLTRERAQELLEIAPSVPDRLDADHDGNACEEEQVTRVPRGSVDTGDGSTA